MDMAAPFLHDVWEMRCGRDRTGKDICATVSRLRLSACVEFVFGSVITVSCDYKKSLKTNYGEA